MLLEYKMHTPTILSIAGYDPYAGAGIVLDTKVIHHLGAYGISAITAITAQNSTGVKYTQSVDSKTLQIQIQTLLDDIQIDALKIGMLSNAQNIHVVCDMIEKYSIKNIVLDPIIKSSSGKVLLDDDAIGVMVQRLFPKVTLLTPNIPEINHILGTNYQGSESEVSKIAKAFFGKLVDAVLIKGGHSNQQDAIDYLVTNNLGATKIKSKRVQTTHTHGTGCFLSSAIATNLAFKKSLIQSVKEAKELLYQRLYLASNIKLNYKEKDIQRREMLI
jgi:hydroxymethylpyrimidine/phosphomethylpyrimidine kinase